MNKLAIASLMAVTSIAWAKGDFKSDFEEQMKELFPKALERKELLLNNTFSDVELGYIATFCKQESADQTNLDLITKHLDKNITGSTRYCKEGYCMVAIKIAERSMATVNDEIF